jgi:SAM-dependent methyltransferase
VPPVSCLQLSIGLMLLAAAGWFLVPILTGLPWRPTAHDRIRRALALAEVRPGELVYDLGSGDGRVVLLAAKEFGARAVGVELSPLQFAWSWARVQARPHRNRVSLRWGDCFHVDLTDADVVIAYMTSSQAESLRRTFERTLRSGARIVTIAFELEGWEPAAFDSPHLIYLYRWPPRRGSLGRHRAKSPAPAP